MQREGKEEEEEEERKEEGEVEKEEEGDGKRVTSYRHWTTNVVRE